MIAGIVAGGRPVPPTAPLDPYFSSVVLLLHGDGTNGSTAIVDSSASGKTATLGGNTKITTSSPKFGTGSIAFDGGDGVLYYTDSPDFDLDGDFTIELFVWVNTLYGTQVLFSKKPSDNGAGWVQAYKNTNDGNLVFAVSTDGTTNSIVYTTTTNPISAGTWNHVAVVRDGNTARFFVGGVQVNTAALAAKPSANTQPLRFGQAGPSNLYDLNGKLDEVRITKGVARYTASFTPPIAAFLDS